MSCDPDWLDKAIRIVEKQIHEMNKKQRGNRQYQDEGKSKRTCMKTTETTEAVSSRGSGKACGKVQIATKHPPVPKKKQGRTGKRTCKPLEREENHGKGPPWPRAGSQMGNVG